MTIEQAPDGLQIKHKQFVLNVEGLFHYVLQLYFNPTFL